MSRTRSPVMAMVVLSFVPFVSLFAGCVSPPPPPEAVLAGTWAVTVENNPDLKLLLLTFDSNGNLQSIEYQVGSNAVITVPAPLGATNVDGNAVTISVSFNNNTLAFNGTLNDTQTVITGDITTLIVVGGLEISINNGPATLTKQ
jgi:hypothetical protein